MSCRTINVTHCRKLRPETTLHVSQSLPPSLLSPPPTYLPAAWQCSRTPWRADWCRACSRPADGSCRRWRVSARSPDTMWHWCVCRCVPPDPRCRPRPRCKAQREKCINQLVNNFISCCKSFPNLCSTIKYNKYVIYLVNLVFSELGQRCLN